MSYYLATQVTGHVVDEYPGISGISSAGVSYNFFDINSQYIALQGLALAVGKKEIAACRSRLC
jgi:hypothetical protein